MTLRTLFAIPIAVILIITLLHVAGMITGEGLARQESGQTAVAAVEQMRLLLALQSRIMAERAATNLILAVSHCPPVVLSRDGSPHLRPQAGTDRQVRMTSIGDPTLEGNAGR